MGYTFYASKGTADFMKNNGIPSETLCWPLEKKEPNILSFIADGKIDLVINIPKNIEKEELDNDYLIRRKAVDFGIPLITNLQLAKRFDLPLKETHSCHLGGNTYCGKCVACKEIIDAVGKESLPQFEGSDE